jgi:hypothetical protein
LPLRLAYFPTIYRIGTFLLSYNDFGGLATCFSINLSRGLSMSDPTPISLPAGYAPAFALGFADSTHNLNVVSDGLRLPVAFAAAAPPPLSGTTSQSLVAGPFAATPGRVITVTLDGQWDGTVRLLRSTDAGATMAPLRVAGSAWAEYTGSGCEQAWTETEEGTSFYLDVALNSGTLAYRVSQ